MESARKGRLIVLAKDRGYDTCKIEGIVLAEL
jgi:hypothetical protein